MYSDTKQRIFFGRKPKKPKAATVVEAPPVPPVPPPPPPPVQDVQVTDTAAKKAQALQRRRGGVASTVMTDSLGG